jgi:hypothetical protein
MEYPAVKKPRLRGEAAIDVEARGEADNMHKRKLFSLDIPECCFKRRALSIFSDWILPPPGNQFAPSKFDTSGRKARHQQRSGKDTPWL